jgi:hypothetical protein
MRKRNLSEIALPTENGAISNGCPLYFMRKKLNEIETDFDEMAKEIINTPYILPILFFLLIIVAFAPICFLPYLTIVFIKR